MNVTSAIGIIFIFAIISLMTKIYLPAYSILINAAAAVIILTLILTNLAPVINKINYFLDLSRIPGEYRVILFKCIGICLVTQFASDSCRDAGEVSLASKAELIGKIAMLTAAMPLFEKLIHTAVGLLGG